MLWPNRLDVVQVPALLPNYKLRTYNDGDDRPLLELLESDGEAMDQGAWQEYQDMLLPNGLFGIEDSEGCLVATAGAVHNPNPDRYYFPFGGELGYLIVARTFRSVITRGEPNGYIRAYPFGLIVQGLLERFAKMSKDQLGHMSSLFASVLIG